MPTNVGSDGTQRLAPSRWLHALLALSLLAMFAIGCVSELEDSDHEAKPEWLTDDALRQDEHSRALSLALEREAAARGRDAEVDPGDLAAVSEFARLLRDELGPAYPIAAQDGGVSAPALEDDTVSATEAELDWSLDLARALLDAGSPTARQSPVPHSPE